MGRRLGQHFLRSKRAARRIAGSISVPPGTSIVEIGPGSGALTEHLLENGAPVIAIERDPSYIPLLRDRFSSAVADGSLTLLEGDARDISLILRAVDGSPYVVMANIPYYLTGSLIKSLLTAARQPAAIALVVQKEVAERITLRSRDKESLLSLSARLFGSPRYVSSFSRRLFSPPPAVDSALIVISDIHQPPQSVQDAFFRVITTAFHQKRKQVLKKFSAMPRVQEALRRRGVPETARAEDVPFSTWLSVAREM